MRTAARSSKTWLLPHAACSSATSRLCPQRRFRPHLDPRFQGLTNTLSPRGLAHYAADNNRIASHYRAVPILYPAEEKTRDSVPMKMTRSRT